jgi:hypothetical protein
VSGDVEMAIFTDPMHLTADGTFEIPINKIPWWRDPITISGFHTQIDGTGVSGDFSVPPGDKPVLEITARYLWRERDFAFERHWNWPWFRMEPGAGVRLGARRYVRTVVVGEDAGRPEAATLGPAMQTRSGNTSSDGHVRSGPESWFQVGSGRIRSFARP